MDKATRHGTRPSTRRRAPSQVVRHERASGPPSGLGYPTYAWPDELSQIAPSGDRRRDRVPGRVVGTRERLGGESGDRSSTADQHGSETARPAAPEGRPEGRPARGAAQPPDGTVRADFSFAQPSEEAGESRVPVPVVGPERGVPPLGATVPPRDDAPPVLAEERPRPAVPPGRDRGRPHPRGSRRVQRRHCLGHRDLLRLSGGARAWCAWRGSRVR